MSGQAAEQFSEDELIQTTLSSVSMPLEMLRYATTPSGSHYVLTHFEVPDVTQVSDEAWTISVGYRDDDDGPETTLLSVSLADVKRMADEAGQGAEIAVTLECAGNGRALMKPRRKSVGWRYGGVSTAAWKGLRLACLLDAAGVFDEGRAQRVDDYEVRFYGHDAGVEPPALAPPGSPAALVAALYPERRQLLQQYSFGVPLARVAEREQLALLAFEMNGSPLPLRHGAPVRALLPGCFGMASVKHLRRVVVQPLRLQNHYWQNIAYHLITEVPPPDAASFVALLQRSAAVLDMLVKSAFVPLGHALDLHAETRLLVVAALPVDVPLLGKAWSGRHAIAKVEWRCVEPSRGAGAEDDDQPAWCDAGVAAIADGEYAKFAWSHWSATWTVHNEGEFRLQVRATNAAGERQPLVAPWNLGGFANNSVQTMTVRVKLDKQQ